MAEIRFSTRVESSERRSYRLNSRGDQFRPRGYYFRTFSSWHAGDNIAKLPVILRPVAMAIRNWRVFWRPRKLEFRYMSDGFATKSQLAFLKDDSFGEAYDRMILATGYPTDPGLHLRVHQAIWAASVAKNIEGDFVECGTGRGMIFSAILKSLNEWSSLGKSAWLFDTFSPFYLDPITGQSEPSLGVRPGYAKDLEQTRANFSEWCRVHCVAGVLPDSIEQVPLNKISLLHIDLNFAPVEKRVLLKLWPRISKGGIVLLDDYGQTESQNCTMDEAARDLGVKILTTGSAQGIIIK